MDRGEWPDATQSSHISRTLDRMIPPDVFCKGPGLVSQVVYLVVQFFILLFPYELPSDGDLPGDKVIERPHPAVCAK